MSYILDALRKVERDRQRSEGRGIRVDRPDKPRFYSNRLAFVLALLLLLNLAWLFYQFVWQGDDGGSVESSQEEVVVKPTPQVENSISSQNQPVTRFENQSKNKQSLALKQDADFDSPRSISQLMAENKALEPPKTKHKPKPKKNVQKSKKPRKVKAVKKSSGKINSAPKAPRKPSLSQAKQNPLPLKSMAKTLVKQQQTKQTARSSLRKIPYLHQMSYEIQEEVPHLVINVYVYDADAAQAFVIINMQKYRVGEKINGLILLKEIGEDGLVLSLRGEEFRVDKP